MADPKQPPNPDAGPGPKKPQLQVHPLIAARLKVRGQVSVPTVLLAGYVGDSGQAGMVRLHPTLTDLSQYLEFDESAVVHASPAPEDVLPRKGQYVWLKANAPVRVIRSLKSQDVARAFAPNRAG